MSTLSASIYQSGAYLAKHPTWHAEDAPWKASQVCRMFERNALRPGDVCEIGCGAGGVLVELQRRTSSDTRFCGYEISPQAHDLCRGKANERLRFVLGDILQDPPARPFDVLLLLDVVEHVENHLEFLRQVRPLGQAKIFHFPLDLSAQSVLRNVPSRVRETAGHLHYFTRELALQTLTGTGYRVLDWFYTPAAIDNGSGMKTRLMRLPRKMLYALHPDSAALCFGGFSLLILAI